MSENLPVQHAARHLFVGGLELKLCNADLTLFSPEGLRHMLEDVHWLYRGTSIFLLSFTLLQYILMIVAARLDGKRNHVLQKVWRIREAASKEYHDRLDGDDPIKGLPAYQDFLELQKQNIATSSMGLSQAFNNLGQAAQAAPLEVDEVRDKSYEWLIRICARNALRYAFKWRMASLEPGSFQYITQQEFLNEASTTATEFVLLPHEKHALIFIITSSRFTSAFLANYKQTRFTRVTSCCVGLLSSVATIVVVYHWMGYFAGHNAGEGARAECQGHAKRDSVLQIVEELLIALAIYTVHEVVHSVMIWIRGVRFLLPAGAVYGRKKPLCEYCRAWLFWMLMFLWYIASLFVVLHFLATGTEEDVDHAIMAIGTIVAFALLIKPLIISTSLIAVWIASTHWRAGMVTEEMVRIVNTAVDADQSTLPKEEIEKLDQEFAHKLLAQSEENLRGGPAFFRQTSDPPPPEDDLPSNLSVDTFERKETGQGSEAYATGGNLDLRTYQVAYSETWPEELRRTVRRFRDVAYNVNDVFGQRLQEKGPGDLDPLPEAHRFPLTVEESALDRLIQAEMQAATRSNRNFRAGRLEAPGKEDKGREIDIIEEEDIEEFESWTPLNSEDGSEAAGEIV